MEPHSRPKSRLPRFSLHLWLGLLISALAALASHAAPIPSSVLVWGQLFDGTITPPPATEGRTIAIAAADQMLMALLEDGSVVCWGSNLFGQTNVPASASHDILAISAGYQHCLALNSDGRVIAWGDNTYGQSSVPAAAQSGVIQIAAGGTHSLALKSDGSVIAWGNNTSAQSTPPAEAQNGITRVSAGKNHSLAITQSGSVIAWGNTHYHQCAVPPAALSGVVAISAGGFHSLALKSDGSLVEWGTTSNQYPEGVPNYISGRFTAVSTGTYYNLALGTDRTLASWFIGALGVANPPGFFPKRFSAIAAGRAFVMALMDDVVPVFTQPPASQKLVEGTSLTLSGSLIGKALSLQWQRDRVNIPGATNLSLTLSPVELGDAGGYSLIASNHWGSSTSSPPVVVTVTPMPPPAIVSSPNSVTSFDGLSLTFSVQASGNLLSYQWRKDGVDLAGATASDLVFPKLRTSDTGSYTVVVSNRRGAVTNATAAYLLVLNSLPPTIVTQPRDTTVTAGTPLKLTVQSAGLPLQYQWFKDGVAIPNATNATFLRIRSATQHAGDYTVVVSTPKGSETSAPPARVIVTPAPATPVLTGGVFDPTYQVAVPPEAERGVIGIGGSSGTDLEYMLSSPIGIPYTWRTALRADGSVVQWGTIINPTSINGFRLYPGTVGPTKGVIDFFSALRAAFLMTDGSITTGFTTAPGIPLNPGSEEMAFIDLTGANYISEGYTLTHLVALRNNGTVVELSSPVEVPFEAQSGVQAIAAGTNYTAALRVDGSVVAWTFPGGIPLPIHETLRFRIRSIATDTNGIAGVRTDGAMVFQSLDGNAVTLPPPVDATLASGIPSFALTTDHRALTWDGSKWKPANVPGWTQGRLLGRSETALLVLDGVPVIKRQPASTTVFEGRPLILSVDGGGPGALYQWYKNGTKIADATNDVLQLNPEAAPFTGAYTAVISNRAGSITSSPPAQVIMAPAPLSGYVSASSISDVTTPLPTVQTMFGYSHVLYLYPDGMVAATFNGPLFTKEDRTGLPVHSWNNWGQSLVPSEALSGVVEIYAGFGYSLARKADGTIIYWGGSVPYGTALISPPSNVRTIESGLVDRFITTDGGVVQWDRTRNVFTQDGVPEAARSGVKSLNGYFGGALKTDGSLIPLYGFAMPAEAQSGMVAFAEVRGYPMGHSALLGAKTDGTLMAWGLDRAFRQFAAKIPNIAQISDVDQFFDIFSNTPSSMVVRTTDGKAYRVNADDPNPQPVQIPPSWQGRIVSFNASTNSVTAILRDIPRPQSIQFSLPESVPFGPTATTLTTTTSSGLPVRYTVLDGPASIVDGVLQITGLGTIRIAADQEGNLAYQPAPRVTQSISVLPGLQITSSVGTPGLSVTLPAGQTAVLERGDLFGPWTPVLNLTGLGAGTPVEIPVPTSDTAATSGFWRVTLDLIRN